MLHPARLLFRRPHKEQQAVFSLTGTDEIILQALGRYTYLTIEQLDKKLAISELSANRGQGKNPRRYVQERCKSLADNGYLHWRWLAAAFPERPQKLYWLTAKGERFVHLDMAWECVP